MVKCTAGESSRINITETLDYEANAIKNRIWYRGDSNELEQLYRQLVINTSRQSFWAAKCSPGMEINKIHTGLPSLIVDMLTSVTLASLNDFDFKRSRIRIFGMRSRKRTRSRSDWRKQRKKLCTSEMELLRSHLIQVFHSIRSLSTILENDLRSKIIVAGSQRLSSKRFMTIKEQNISCMSITAMGISNIN